MHSYPIYYPQADRQLFDRYFYITPWLLIHFIVPIDDIVKALSICDVVNNNYSIGTSIISIRYCPKSLLSSCIPLYWWLFYKHKANPFTIYLYNLSFLHQDMLTKSTPIVFRRLLWNLSSLVNDWVLRNEAEDLIFPLHCCLLIGFWSYMRFVKRLLLLFFSSHFELQFTNIIVKKNLLEPGIEENNIG